MTTEIHVYFEFREKLLPNSPVEPKPWQSLGANMNPGRNYSLFGFMAHVRTNMGKPFPPKGFPRDAGYWALMDNYAYVSNNPDTIHCVTEQMAETYVKDFECHYRADAEGEHTWVSVPIWHTHSWLVLNEFEKVMHRYNHKFKTQPEPVYDAILAAMKTLDKKKYESRLVFWFEEKE
jgi:hypothetical protein